MKKATLVFVTLVYCTLFSSNLSTQQFPSKLIRIIVLTINIFGLFLSRNMQLSIEQV